MLLPRKHTETLITLFCFVIFLPFLLIFMQWLEPIIAPVITDVTFEQINEDWRVTFNKVRNCELIGVYWFNGETWILQEFDNQFTRPLGPAVIENWPVPDNVDIETDVSIVRHKCHALWNIDTPFRQQLIS